MYCIYQITNKTNGKRYIGQHKYTDELNPMGKYKGSGVLLRKAYKKYGMENFETEILYRRIRDKSTVDAMEIYAIDKYKPEYNISRGGTGGCGKQSEETKRKLSEAFKGKPRSEETKKKISDAKFKRYIRCIETNEVHYWGDWRNLGYTHAYNVALGNRKICKGLHFEFVDGKRVLED